MESGMFMEFVCSVGILGLLIKGIVSDLRTMTVSNTVTFGIIGLSIPLIYWNLPNIGIINFVFLGIFFVAYLFGLGGADLKALFPLLFIFPDVMFFAGSLAVMGAIHLTIEHYRHIEVPWRQLKVPYFVPITMTYLLMVIT